MPRSRTESIQRTTSQILRRITGAIAVIAFSPFEEEFFREGDQLGVQHDFSDLDEGAARPPTLWRAVVGWLRNERTQSPD